MAFILISLVLGLCGCTTKHITIEQSQKNFLTYQDSLEKVASQYNLELTETKDFNFDDLDSIKDFVVFINTESQIRIRMINSAFESEKGVESFSIDYTIVNTDFENDFNIQLFVDLVNCISGKTVSVDLCNEFLSAPESKYAAEKYGFQKLNGEKIAKEYPLNSFEDWNISYVLNKDGEETLTLGGLTLQTT